VPVTVRRVGWVAWGDGVRYAAIHPCAGALAHPADRTVPSAPGALLGTARAEVLTLLASP
jgi:hypothetical protein